MGDVIDLVPTTYTDEEIERGLQQLALCSGNARQALARLEEQAEREGVPCRFRRSTLDHWKRSKADRYYEIRKEIAGPIRARLAAQHEDAAALAIEKAGEIVARIDPEEIAFSDLAKNAQQLAVTAGIHTDKASVLRNQPTEIIGITMDAEANLDAIARLAPGAVIDSTAVEITDADVLDPDEAA